MHLSPVSTWWKITPAQLRCVFFVVIVFCEREEVSIENRLRRKYLCMNTDCGRGDWAEGAGVVAGMKGIGFAKDTWKKKRFWSVVMYWFVSNEWRLHSATVFSCNYSYWPFGARRKVVWGSGKGSLPPSLLGWFWVAYSEPHFFPSPLCFLACWVYIRYILKPQVHCSIIVQVL